MSKREKREKLIAALKALRSQLGQDVEANHVEADRLLVDFIDDPEISTAYDGITKWYA